MAEEEIVLAKHKAYAREMRVLNQVSGHLADEVCHKRCQQRGKFYILRPQYKFLEPYRTNILYMGKKHSFLGVFPSLFQCYMEDSMVAEAPHVSIINVYYGRFPEYEGEEVLDMTEWTIHPTDSSGDVALIKRFRDTLIEAMERWTNDAIKVLGEDDHGVKLMVKEMNRFKKVSNEFTWASRTPF